MMGLAVFCSEMILWLCCVVSHARCAGSCRTAAPAGRGQWWSPQHCPRCIKAPQRKGWWGSAVPVAQDLCFSPTLHAVLTMLVSVIIDSAAFQLELDTRHDKYERLVKLSRDITIESKRTIFLLHRFTRWVTLRAKVFTETGKLPCSVFSICDE